MSILALFLFFFCLGQGVAADVMLAWDASESPEVTGYKVYVGNAPGNYNEPITIGNQTSYTVTGLNSGTYYFAIKAINAYGDESDFSNEVSVNVNGNSCDLNNDGNTNVLDIQRMVNIVLGITSPSSSYDLNNNGTIDVLDLQILNNVVLGLRSCQ